MEGRKKLPINIHPFPDDIDVWKKFWGTPLSKAFFKTSAVVLGLMFSMGLTNMYITRNAGFLGQDISSTKEQIRAKERLRDMSWELKRMQPLINLGFRHEQPGADKYDDRVEVRSRIIEPVTPETGKNTLVML